MKTYITALILGLAIFAWARTSHATLYDYSISNIEATMNTWNPYAEGLKTDDADYSLEVDDDSRLVHVIGQFTINAIYDRPEFHLAFDEYASVGDIVSGNAYCFDTTSPCFNKDTGGLGTGLVDYIHVHPAFYAIHPGELVLNGGESDGSYWEAFLEGDWTYLGEKDRSIPEPATWILALLSAASLCFMKIRVTNRVPYRKSLRAA